MASNQRCYEFVQNKRPRAEQRCYQSDLSRVAHRFDTVAARVERVIGHAIEVARDRGNLETLQNYFFYTVSNAKGKPTNSEFMAIISERTSLAQKRHVK